MSFVLPLFQTLNLHLSTKAKPQKIFFKYKTQISNQYFLLLVKGGQSYLKSQSNPFTVDTDIHGFF